MVSMTNTGPWQLDILAQQPRLNRLYTQLTFCFDIPNEEHDQVLTDLEKACKEVSNHLPWVAGSVVYQEGRFVIVKKNADKIPTVVKSCTEQSFHSLAVDRFPFSMLGESSLAPCKTMATSDATIEPLPVLMIQINLLDGGILLTFAGQHGAMDMAGMSQMIRLLSKASRKEPLSPTELSVGNIDRGEPPSRLDGSSQADGQTTQHSAKKSEELLSDLRILSGPSNLVWSYFSFSSSALALLKSTASNSISEGSFISTDDVLTAFVWLSMTRARRSHSQDLSNSTTTLSRQVNLRQYLALPAEYPGMLVESTTHTFQVKDLLQQSLGKIATQLRSGLHKSTLVRQFELQVARIEQDNIPTRSKRTLPQQEVRLSSWSMERCYDLDFGFGKPVCVRRPAFYEGAREGLVYFLPKRLDGEITVGICLVREDIDRLRNDKDFCQVGEYIG